MNGFIFFFSLQTNLFANGVEFNSEIVKEREVDSLAPNLQLQDVKVEVKGENDITEIIDEEPKRDSPAPKSEVKENSANSNAKIEVIFGNSRVFRCELQENENVKDEMNFECGELEDFIVKKEAVDEVETRTYELNQVSRILTHVGKRNLQKCDSCGKYFPRNCELTQHIEVHTGEQPYNCEECGKSFPMKNNLSKHILIHKDCGKSFAKNGDLSRHILTHTGGKPHECDKCGKFFSIKSNLSKHILYVHMGEKSHKCEECGKQFSQKSHLSQHILCIHMGQKPHKCEECGKSFSQKSHLSQHILIHKIEKIHKCKECGKYFRTMRYLSRHIIRCTGEKPRCEKCGKSFSFMGNLFRHIRVIHPQ